MLQIQRNNQTISHNTQQQQQQYVPLKCVNVEAAVRSFAANVTITQVFRNDETTPIEAVYCFPMEEQAAVYAFRAVIDDREIIAELKEKKEAQQEYNDALQQGHGAYMLEQDENSPDNFIINVGALLPGKECKIIISYVSELDLIENGTKIRLVVPTSIAPRYNPGKGGISSPAGTTTNYVQSSSFTIEFHCRIEKAGIARISSLSHPIQIDFAQLDVYVVEFAQKDTHLDRDILVDIELAKTRPNTIVAIEQGAIMASFTPTEEDCRLALNNAGITNEFMFIVDCSGSMDSENKIEVARQTLELFLKSLPVGCHFNIIRFGSEHKTLFNDVTVIYNEDNVQKAQQLTKNMTADLGGTELMKPFQWLEEHPPTQGHSRQIFLLTDGEISNVNQVLDLCRSMSTSTRIFSFGLGSSPSRSLVKGLARATNGRFVFIPPNTTSVDVYVGEQLRKALQPCITNVQIKWNLATPVTSVPIKTPPVYVNDRLIVYAMINDTSIAFDHQANIELYVGQHRLGGVQIDRIPSVSNDETISRLAAKALILELQHSKVPSSTEKNIAGSKQARFQEQNQQSTTKLDGTKEETKKRIIELSLQYNILSPHTAFVGIEKRVNGNNVDMALREIPIQVSADDKHVVPSLIPNVSTNARWAQNGMTVAGSHGKGNSTNQLWGPCGLFVDDDQTMVIADCFNHRIVQWRMGDMNGQVVAGGNGNGNRLDQLNGPTDVFIDKETDSLIVCDRENRRVVRWSRRSGTIQGEILIDNIACWGMAMDDQRYLYISDIEKHEIRRYQMGDNHGILVAGGNGKGNGLNQLNMPTNIFVDPQQTVYVSDQNNHRVMKWNKGTREGIIVAGGQGEGQALTQLSYPNGVFIDTLGTIYIGDSRNHRVMRWPKGAKQGTVIMGGNGKGIGANQLDFPMGLSFDRQGNLYVVDHYNQRVQRYSIE
ncbi:unnamed protein product [Rotaria sp. Silwood2]|nr:unnamed protein product [Rotaria sp. Silwood2]CAF4432264.1 unnamed protein product [Rotaria sp. Silwood2]